MAMAIRESRKKKRRKVDPKKCVLFLIFVTACGNFLSTTILFSTSNVKKSSGLSPRLGDNRFDARSIPAIILQSYTWKRKQWVPTKDHEVPTYRPHQMQQILEKHNLLFLGDSTSRQNFATMFHVAKHAGIANEISDIDAQSLREDINLNKFNVTYSCEKRDFSTTVRGVLWDIHFFFCWDTRLSGTSSWFQGAVKGSETGKFDYGSRHCTADLIEFIDLELGHGKNGTEIMLEYDTLVTAIGLWEVESSRYCRTRWPDTSHSDRILQTLDKLRLLASPKLRIIWTTTGPSEHAADDMKKRKMTEEINIVARQWFQDNQPRHMYLLDFELQIRPRSLGKDRIKGDYKTHWGNEARTLHAQMLTHILATIDGIPFYQ